LRSRGDPTLESDCRRHLESLVREGIVEVVKYDSAGYAAQCAHRKVDFVFVDAAHGYQSDTRDIRARLPMVKRRGTVAGDDFWWRPAHQEQTHYQQVLDVTEYPVWRAMNQCLNGRFNLMVRQSWAIWWRVI
jgi:predicted O-methyltransferase YrrM